MTSFYNRFKSLATGFIALSFFAAVTFGACTSNKKGGSQDSEKVEHPSNTQEHPSDSVSTESEHPSSSEHPSGSEHPN